MNYCVNVNGVSCAVRGGKTGLVAMTLVAMLRLQLIMHGIIAVTSLLCIVHTAGGVTLTVELLPSFDVWEPGDSVWSVERD